VVFEASDRVGGRVCTEVLGDFVFDAGATSIAPRGRTLERVMLTELSQEGLVRVEKPFYVHHGLRIEVGDPQRMIVERYTYAAGNKVLPERLALGLDVRLGTRIAQITEQSGQFLIGTEPFDRLILACPPSDAVPLLQFLKSGKTVSYVSYRPCISVLLGMDDALGDLPFHALVEPDQRHPLTWVSIENLKCEGRAPSGKTALVAQMSPEYSRQMFDAEDSRVYHDTLQYLSRLFGKDWTTPEVSKIVRFRNSQPENMAMFESVNAAGDKIVLAGDALMGGRAELAYEVGIRAAELVIS
jgi:predicted NAD/FAD-dependent oxidoreductase